MNRQDVARRIRETYERATPASAAASHHAARSLPGGDTRSMTWFAPYPLYLVRGEGTRVQDADGHWYEDMIANYGALAHGHNHPALVAAVTGQMARGTAPGGPVPLQYEHAERLRALNPSLERVRYCNSGTEATMWAVRTARAYTGRDVLVKIDGGYHGTHEWGQVNAFFASHRTAPARLTGLPETRLAPGVALSTADDIVAVPYNDLPTAATVLGELGEQVAAVVVEPVLGVGGGVPSAPGYLAGLRRLTRETGALLVFDECATLRLGPWQVKHGVIPDLTTHSKIVGGGLPLGVFGGREDVMALFDPSRSHPVHHAGAFGGNSLSLAAGSAALDHFGTDEIAHLDSLGDRLRAGLDAAAASVGVAGRSVGEGGLSYFHFGSTPPRDAADTARLRAGRAELRSLLHLSLLNAGFLTAPHGLLCQHVPTAPESVDALVDAYGNALHDLRPYIAVHHPELLEKDAGHVHRDAP
ncbi:aspartate aminotransferase family protein [Streptomyces sp. b94]|uniref:aspartate aminotransferase family protein n=1 Tax=Streptomyces sp. b94 TaxID=1827634 RepID=UPI000BF198D6|nr:aminotransferase class III-fold pyridoxal phosphate-dependent enzyme [Streptomyces sp. b94]